MSEDRIPPDILKKREVANKRYPSWQLLECEVCKKLGKPRLYLCDNGHNICSECKVVETKCCCKADILDKHNIVMEGLAKSAHYPCVFAEFGCKDTFKLSRLPYHEGRCERRGFDCVPGKDDGCTWRGPREEIRKHVEQNHPDKVYCWGGKLPSNCPTNGEFKYLLFAYDNMFWYYSKRDAVDDNLLQVIQCIGDPYVSSEFYYQFGILKDGNMIAHSFLHRVFSEWDDVEDIFARRECLTVPKKVIDKYSNSIDLFKYRIILLKKFPLENIPPGLNLPSFQGK